MEREPCSLVSCMLSHMSPTFLFPLFLVECVHNDQTLCREDEANVVSVTYSRLFLCVCLLLYPLPCQTSRLLQYFRITPFLLLPPAPSSPLAFTCLLQILLLMLSCPFLPLLFPLVPSFIPYCLYSSLPFSLVLLFSPPCSRGQLDLEAFAAGLCLICLIY